MWHNIFVQKFHSAVKRFVFFCRYSTFFEPSNYRRPRRLWGNVRPLHLTNKVSPDKFCGLKIDKVIKSCFFKVGIPGTLLCYQIKVILQFAQHIHIFLSGLFWVALYSAIFRLAVWTKYWTKVSFRVNL